MHCKFGVDFGAKESECGAVGVVVREDGNVLFEGVESDAL